MNVLNLLTKSYGKLHSYRGIPYWVLTPFRRIIRRVTNVFLPNYLAKIHRQRLNNRCDVIVSLTSFPARINTVWMVVESLKNQTLRPMKIILWLSKEQFPTKQDIPNSLWECEDSLFEVRIVDGDIRSHKKYYYVLQEYPDKSFVTCDDDIYYHPKMLQKLVETGKRYQCCIIANDTAEMKWDGEGNLKSYKDWGRDPKAYSSKNLVQIGIGGVLYPPHCLCNYVTRMDLFTRLAPLADDLWLSLMARLNGTPVIQAPDYALPLPIESNAPTLSSENNGNNMNDQQIIKMREWLQQEGLEDVYSSDYNIEVRG